ncbi:MAG: tRNA pseudouridine(55) synthase TruB [Nocardioidaceae bacterium]
MSAPDGLLVVDKPAGWTSHDVVARSRRLAGTRKVGHAGTLDPMATGVLVLGVGRGTRLLGHLALSTKAYVATMRLGQSTVTDDAEGDLLGEHDASGVTDPAITATVRELVGDLLQTPSSVSAIKVDGQRAYKRVRAGDEVRLAPRPVRVTRFDVLAVRRRGGFVDVDVDVECSTGTYVRALARDVGDRLGVGGHLTALRRTRVGPYPLESAFGLESLSDRVAEELPVVPLVQAAHDNFATHVLSDDQVVAVRNGRAVTTDLGATGPVAVFDAGGEFLALYEHKGEIAKAVAVFV